VRLRCFRRRPEAVVVPTDPAPQRFVLGEGRLGAEQEVDGDVVVQDESALCVVLEPIHGGRQRLGILRVSQLEPEEMKRRAHGDVQSSSSNFASLRTSTCSKKRSRRLNLTFSPVSSSSFTSSGARMPTPGSFLLLSCA